MKIEPLSRDSLDDACRMILNVFRYSKPQDEDYPPRWFKASLEPENNKTLYASFDVKYLKYWVAIDNKKVIGVVGLYSLDYDEKEAYWLGWYCVDPEFRGKGIGKALLDFVMAKAKSDGKKWLRLYTSNEPNERKANEIYDKLGFKPIKEKKIKEIIASKRFRAFTENLVYKELKLK